MKRYFRFVGLFFGLVMLNIACGLCLSGTALAGPHGGGHVGGPAHFGGGVVHGGGVWHGGGVVPGGAWRGPVYGGGFVRPGHIYAAPAGWYFRGPVYAGPLYFATNWYYFGRSAWYSPGFGYVYVAPAARGPITVVVQETVVDPFTGASSLVTMYYNAYWYGNAGFYGYYDSRSVFHWVTW